MEATPPHPLPPATPAGGGAASNSIDDYNNNNNNNNNNSASTDKKRTRQPRNSACAQCAALKMKCVSSPVPGKCERCNRMGRACVPAVPKPRKRRAESGGAGGGEPSSGIIFQSGLDTDVTSSGASTKHPVNSLSAFAPVIPTDSLLSTPDIRHNGSKSFSTLFARALGSEDLPQGVDYTYVQTSFTVFRQFITHFPFVSTLLGADAVAMVAQRPITAIAVCTVTAESKSGMQQPLSHLFRQTLSRRTIMEGECSMDLMVGLLIHLNWHHHYMAKPQLYQDLCLLAGMAVDLGLYKQTPQTNVEDLGAAVERDRAFLGCYYLCCNIAMKGFNKPNPLRWTGNLRRCAENVARNGKLPSDRNLLPLIELTYVLEELTGSIQTGVDLKRSTIAYFVEMHSKAANNRLKSLKREHPPLASHPAFSAATIDVHHKLLAASGTTDTLTLIQCACAIKEYIDDILAHPPIMLHQIAIVDWTNLLQVLVLMALVSRPLPNNTGWESGALTSMLQPDNILDAICQHMGSAPTGDPLAPIQDPLLHQLRRFFDYIKEQIIRGPETPVGVQSSFRPANDGDVAVSELPLPYDASLTPGNFDGGILHEGVLDSFLQKR